jgi:hypothetical protein
MFHTIWQRRELHPLEPRQRRWQWVPEKHRAGIGDSMTCWIASTLHVRGQFPCYSAYLVNIAIVACASRYSTHESSLSILLIFTTCTWITNISTCFNTTAAIALGMGPYARYFLAVLPGCSLSSSKALDSSVLCLFSPKKMQPTECFFVSQCCCWYSHISGCERFIFFNRTLHTRMRSGTV